MADESLADMLELARRLGVEAIEITRPHVGKIKPSHKPDRSVVTEADHAVQRNIVAAVSEQYPQHAFFTEETLETPNAYPDRGSARYCWVIDPIDGTRNFVAGFACFGTSIGVLDRGVPVVAVVVEHNLGHVYTAIAGGGAALNGRRLHMIDPDPAQDLMVGVPSSKDPLTQAVVALWQGTQGMIPRNIGASALHLGMVASGALGAMFCKKCKIWDIAAGALLVTEAGGRISLPSGEPRIPLDVTANAATDTPILAAAPKTHERLLAGITGLAVTPKS